MIKDKRERNIFIWLAISGLVAVVGGVIVLNTFEPVFQLSISGTNGVILYVLGVGGMFVVVFKYRDYYKKKYEESLKKDDTQ